MKRNRTLQNSLFIFQKKGCHFPDSLIISPTHSAKTRYVLISSADDAGHAVRAVRL